MTRKKLMGDEPQDDGREADLMELERESQTSEQDLAIEKGLFAPSDAPMVPTGTAEQRLATKRANFSRLASKRVTGVLERLSVLKNLANTNTYDWTQEQHDKIFDTIGEMFDEVVKAFVEAKKPKARDKSQLRFEV
jgi:hypothetical protein